MYRLIQKTWHYLKCVIFQKKEIGINLKRHFFSFGNDSIINRPYLQLSGINKISIGKNTTILDGCRLAVYGDGNDPAIIIGDGCYIGFSFSALAVAHSPIVIGNNVLFASNVLVTSENHGINPESDLPYMNQELTGKKTIIGNGCWIGEKVCILPGVSIGEKTIIGAGAVVTKSIPSYAMAVGNPAKVIKHYNIATNKWEKYHDEIGAR